MKNIEKHYDEIKQRLETTDVDNLFCTVNEFKTGCDDCTMLSNCRNCCLKNLEWLNQDYKEKILDDVEREYLSAVIKPFRKKISCIRKSKDSRKGKNYIKIEFCDGDCMFFPNLSNNAMYKGMEIGRNYTLDELGL